MNILKAGSLTAVATLARLVSGFLVMKMVAVFAGPTGVAQLGQFMSLIALLVVFAGGGIAPGVIKYIAEFRNDQHRTTQLLRGAFSFTLVASLLMCFLVLVFSEKITVLLLSDIKYRSLIVILAFSQFFVAMHNLFVAIINGMMDVKRLAAVHVCGAVVGVAAPAILGYYLGVYGVLLAYIGSQSFLMVISFLFYRKSPYFSWLPFKFSLDRGSIHRLARFSVMTLTSALLAPVVQIVVRQILADKFTWEEVGYWQAVSKVSEAYLLFVTMAISVYYLPRLSAIDSKVEFKKEILNGYKVLLPITIIMSLFVYFFRDLITRLLFSEGFEGALYLYFPQLVGDMLKIASFVLSYIMLAKAMTRVFFFSELFFSSMYVGWVYVLTSMFGLIGSMYAFVVNYCIYLVFNIVVAKLYIGRMK